MGQKELKVWPWARTRGTGPLDQKRRSRVSGSPRFSDGTPPAPVARPALYLWPRSYQAANMSVLVGF